MSKRMFLHEYMSLIYKAPQDAKMETIAELCKNKRLAEFFDLTYNKNYHWEFDKKYKPTLRNVRDNGGDIMGWYEVVKIARRQLIKSTSQSSNFTKRLDRILETCNHKDIPILLCSLNNRSIKYINTKDVYKYFPEYNEKEDEE